MPQAIGMQIIMQIVQKLVQKIMEMVSEMMQKNASQEQMQQATQQQMEQDGVMQRQQQVDTYNEAGNNFMSQGSLAEAAVCFGLGELRAQMDC